jgi:hypothetical protein
MCEMAGLIVFDYNESLDRKQMASPFNIVTNAPFFACSFAAASSPGAASLFASPSSLPCNAAASNPFWLA